jgi:DNA repair exonuclease SbcCD ATPase subunit
MKLLSVEWRNVGSYGNQLQKIEFPQDETGLYVVTGGNGHGKSTISDVITFNFYGRLVNKKMKDIPNRINGNAWTKVCFISNKRQKIVIERGHAPSLFVVSVDGVPYEKSGKSNVQQYLEDEILEIPFYVFVNIISININDFKSFLKMNASDKRGIIDRIFGFQIINSMIQILRDQGRKLKEQADGHSSTITAITRSLNNSENEIKMLTEKLNNSSLERLDELQINLKKFDNLLTFHKQKFDEFKDTENQFKQSMRKMQDLIVSERSNIQNLEKRIKLYENKQCPTCTGYLDTEFHQSVLQNLLEHKERAEDDLRNNMDILSGMKNKEKEYESMRRDLIEKGTKIGHNMNSISDEIKKLSNSKLVDEQLSSMKNIINNLKEDLNENKNNKFAVDEKSNWLKILEEVLGEKGVKQLAIKTILPSLNSEIQKLLIEMHLDFRVVFDEEFNAAISHLGEEISASTLSFGESKKVDFSVLMSVIKLMKIRFSGMNFLFLDEIFASLDADSIHCILKILRKNTKELGLNTFVIAQTQLPLEIFDFKLEIVKNNNFSSMTIEKL